MKDWKMKTKDVPKELKGSPKEQAQQLFELLKDRTLSIEALKEILPMDVKVIEEFTSCMKSELEANRKEYDKVIDSFNVSLDVLRNAIKDGKLDADEREKIRDEIYRLHQMMADIHDKHEARRFDLLKWITAILGFIMLVITVLGSGKNNKSNQA